MCAGMVAPWQERAKSASLSLLRWRAARRETEVPAFVVEVMLVILCLKAHQKKCINTRPSALGMSDPVKSYYDSESLYLVEIVANYLKYNERHNTTRLTVNRLFILHDSLTTSFHDILKNNNSFHFYAVSMIPIFYVTSHY